MAGFRRCGAGLLVAGASALSVLGAPAAATPAAAQAPDTARDTLVYRVDPIRATATRSGLPAARLPAALTRLSGASLRMGRKQIDLHEVLRSVPGVAVDNRHNMALGTRVAVRGFGSRAAFGVRGVRILLDGIPLTLPDGQAALTAVDPGSLGRVEVLRGPASVLHGNAAGGVVSLGTRTGEELGGAVAVEGAAGSYGGGALDLARARAESGHGGPAGSWYVGVSHLELDGYREHAEARRTGVSARARAAVGGGVLSGALHAAAVPVAENPGSLPADSAAARPRAAWPNNERTRSGEEVLQALAGLSYVRPVGNADLELAVHGQGRSLENPLPFGRYIRLRRAAGGARAVLRGSAGGLGWTAGLEAEVMRDDRLERENLEGEIGGETFRDQIDRVAGGSPFALLHASPAPWLELSAGGRYDAVRFEVDDRRSGAAEDVSGDRVLEAWSGSVGALVRAGERVALWGSASTWFGTPTTTELLNAPPEAGQPCCAGGLNPDLEPQEGWGGELGVRRRGGGLDWELVGFAITVGNEILPLQVEGQEGREFYHNAGRSLRRGIEAAVEARPLEAVELRAAYTYSDFRFTDGYTAAIDGNRLPGIAPGRANLEARWVPPSTLLAIELEAVSRYPVDDAGTAHNAGYAVVDVRAARDATLGGWRLRPFVEVSNLFDRRYSSSVVINAFGGRFYEPAPGRTLLVGLQATIR